MALAIDFITTCRPERNDASVKIGLQCVYALLNLTTPYKLRNKVESRYLELTREKVRHDI